MPDINLPEPRGIRATAERIFAAADEAVHGGLAGSVAVAAVAGVLALAHVELQYVAGAFIIVFAKRLAAKRITTQQVVDQAPKRKYADMFPPPPTPLARDLGKLADD